MAAVKVILLQIALCAVLKTYAEKTICADVDCPDTIPITCPSDSDLQLVQPYKPSTITDDDDYKTLQKRAVAYTGRERIKITPGDYTHKKKRRSAETENEPMIAKCCPYYKCVCKEECSFTCPFDTIPVQNHSPSLIGKPGNCCPSYQCMKPHYCRSQTNHKYYQNGAEWQEGECSTCTCWHGEVKCHMSQCRTPSCMKTVKVLGECCPVCDNNGTNFCAGQEDCDRICKHGYKRDNAIGCDMCKCRHKSTTPTTTTTTQPSSVETSVNEIKDNSSLIINDNDSDNNINSNKQNGGDSWTDFNSNLYKYIIYPILAAIFALAIFFGVLKYHCIRRNKKSYNTVPANG